MELSSVFVSWSMNIILNLFSDGIAFLYSLLLSKTDLIEMSPPFQLNLSNQRELLSIMFSELASFRIVHDKLPLIINSLGISFVRMFVGSQFVICACFNLIHVERPAGPGLLSLAIKFEI